MSSIIYRCDGSDVPLYQLEMLQAGQCPHLIQASVQHVDDHIIVCPNISGLFHPKTFLAVDGLQTRMKNLSHGLHPEVLKWLRLVAEGVAALEDHLVEESQVSYKLDDLYIDLCANQVKAVLAQSGKTLIDGLCDLSLEIYAIRPESHADVIAKKLMAHHAERILGCRQLLALLSSWESEYRNGH
jgi:hypothetical protein